MKHHLILLVSIFSIIACSEDPLPGTESNGTLIFRIGVDNQLEREHQFYEDGRLSSYWINGVTYEYTYPGDSMHISTIQGGQNLVNELFYPMGQNLFVKQELGRLGELREFWEYEVSSSCFFSEIRKYTADSILWQRVSVSFPGTACHHIAYTYGSDSTLMLEERFVYDTQQSYIPIYLLQYLGVPSLGNTTEYTRIKADGNIDSVLSYTSNFIYNLDDFPVWEERSFLSGGKLVFEYTYY